MVMPAAQAQSYTFTSKETNTKRDVQQELSRTNSAIQSASGKERFEIVYNAVIIGNPFEDPQDDSNLTESQILYRDALIDAGYKVSREKDTGYWFISWAVLGPEEIVTVYSVRTILLPGTYASQTIEQIEEYFSTVSPAVTVKATVVSINGGDIDEGDFGATFSEFYEYIALVTQPNSEDHSTDLKNNLIVNISSYNDSNLEAYKLVERTE